MPIAGLTKRACDQCHNVKERCRRLGPNDPCERCTRLGQHCQTTRYAVKTGRKPRGLKKLSYTLPTFANLPATRDTAASSLGSSPSGLSPYDGGMASNPALFSSLDEWERHFLNLMKDILAPSPLDKFLVGPSFHETHHTSFVQNLIRPTPVLKHAAVACAAVLFGDQNDEYSQTSVEIGHKRAALVVSSLRSFNVSNEQDLATVLILGVAMVTFAMHVADGQPFLISHYTLSLIKPQVEKLFTLDPAMIDFWMCLVSTETFECLLRSEIPTMRVDPTRRENVVDRYLGLSSTIFTHLYDICAAATALKHASTARAVEVVQDLNSIKAAVDKWQPLPPSDFLNRYTQAEVLSMLVQAKIFRIAALLMIHRLQHPFGEQDREAHVLSRAIIAEFDMILQMTQRSIPCTALPYLAACFEILDFESRHATLKNSKQIVAFSKQSQIRFEATLTSVWQARDLGHQFHWFELGIYASTLWPGK
ncbi:hypothetical protein N7532_010749 [Penicillium argentinense]|uniref:Zn(2)-C6 fungal-type domain-containing protein n=1 Tax=Penicillium argentinense TaxID=1131581 RepID=A0A9W9JY82_9EURO|nr:uncharacterized protein N7532_010749 [Penicillium argentinense]KAJ5085978.1 hypothetical protein N7532_010749 [Penicillium argentinense]